MPDKAPKILVVRMSSLGDIILTAPVYRNIKAAWPNARITLLVKPQYQGALKGHPAIDEIIPFEGFFKTLKRIRAAGFTHYLDLHATQRSIMLGLCSGIENKTRYAKDSLARRLFVNFRIQNPALERHVLNRYLDSLKAWNIPALYADPELNDRAAQGAQTAAPERICILQTAFLGDAVLTVPLIKRTAEIFPDAKISVVARPETADIFRKLERVSAVIEDRKKSLSSTRSFSALTAALKAGNFQLAIIPHRSLRSALAAKMAGIPERIGFDSSAGRFFLTKRVTFSWLLHDAERNLSLLNAVARTQAMPEAVAIKADAALAEKLLTDICAETGWQNPALIGVHPGSVWFTKRWFPERFAAVIRTLHEKTGAKAVLVGGKQDFELCRGVAALCPGMAVNRAGKTGIPELMALTSRMKLFITNDSGPMHIATAYNVPTIGIFGPTTKELGFFPYGKGHRVMQAQLSCRPCALHGGKKCPHGHFLCMRMITAQDVSAAAIELINC
jgi:heptosyltransferase-2